MGFRAGVRGVGFRAGVRGVGFRAGVGGSGEGGVAVAVGGMEMDGRRDARRWFDDHSGCTGSSAISCTGTRPTANTTKTTESNTTTSSASAGSGSTTIGGSDDDSGDSFNRCFGLSHGRRRGTTHRPQKPVFELA